MKQNKSVFSLPNLYQHENVPENATVASDRIEFIKNSLHSKISIETRDQQIEKYNYLMELLFLHEHFNLLSEKEVQTCFDMASTLIKLIGAYSKKNSMSFKYAELFHMRSKIENNAHDHWGSYWSSLLETYCLPQVEDGEQYLALGVRSMRLFQGELASKYYTISLKLGLPDQYRDYFEIQRIRCYYLTNQLSDAETAINREGVRHQRSELTWCKSIIEAIKFQDISFMKRLCSKGGDCYYWQNILVFYGWALSVKTRRWIADLVPVYSLRRRKNLEFNAHDMYFKAIGVLQECYDFERPFIQRLEKLGTILKDVTRYESEEQELLIWAAATRWLWRSRAREFAKACLCQYRQRSLNLSQGICDDILQVVKDIQIHEI